jgi:hypothetical protein
MASLGMTSAPATRPVSISTVADMKGRALAGV